MKRRRSVIDTGKTMIAKERITHHGQSIALQHILDLHPNWLDLIEKYGPGHRGGHHDNQRQNHDPWTATAIACFEKKICLA